MTDEIKFPVEYVPFKELIICSNIMIDGKVPFTIKMGVPLLVGRGEVPLIWLAVPISKEASDWKYVVEGSQSLDKRYDVISFDEGKSIRIMLDNINLIQVNKISDEKAKITNLDLRPLGINIYGDNSGLFVGTNRMAKNTFNSIFGMVKID
jgi:hypothetical protein